ncbi:uncharacterized protein LOC142982319 [Anticarsia gemmatalis]|uniref:uncharacterized protein LOC142982319 n=1 Tax=Anticarsia gemmatalis TaxID=129554 RepID=UPI003F76B1A2
MAVDFTKICRICLESNKLTYDIYTCYYVKRNTLYCDMLADCTKLKPSVDDGLPRLICKECSRQLKRTYSFNIQCETSEQKLKFLLENSSELDSKTVQNADGSCGANVKDELLVELEKIEDKSETNESTQVPIFDDNSKDEKDNIKLEPLLNDDGDDSCWDADDDNVLLEDMKVKKTEPLLDNAENSCWEADDDVMLQRVKVKKTEAENEEDRPKKKRGRKKKVYVEGEIPRLPESKLPHQCDVCGKFLSTKSNLKAHKLCHTDLRPYMCPDCPATFRGHSALFQHKKVHTGETPYHCEYCPKQFSRRTGLVNHIRMHKGEKLYSCELCFKTFVQSAQLSIHMKRHKGDKPYLCQICGKGFPIKAELKVHQRIHNGEKPYSCHLCSKTFATSGNLSIHIRIHNKEVRYNCKECSRGFVTCSAYNVHLKRHKGQRDYHCECGKTFYTSSALKQHRVVHTGEKKYQCKICDRKFTQTSHLSRHFKKDHAKPNAPVPSSAHYKVLVEENKDVFGLLHGTMQKIGANLNTDVKCEGS